MENLNIPGTSVTPEINLNSQLGVMEVSGRSLVEDAWAFYLPILNWLDQYVAQTAHKKTIIRFRLEYYNTSSSKAILEILKTLEQLSFANREVHCQWFQDEEETDDILLFVSKMQVEVLRNH
ncbi:MAG: DUF1987 domain-containing protein [Bacteroidia bacterium]|nr:DUF1987 domain-containing protein [Bacteroidia bacterium]